MLNSVPWYIGLRYTRSKRRNGFIAFVSGFALLGMALGVFALIVTLSVMNGFGDELKGRILRVIPHGFVTHRNGIPEWPVLVEQLKLQPGVLAAAPFIEGKALISYDNKSKPLLLQGISPREDVNATTIEQGMVVGELAGLEDVRYGIVLGALVARYLGVATGDKVSILIPELSITPAGARPRTKRFTVVGVFSVGAQVDQSLALISLRDAQKLYRKPDSVAGIRLKFDDIYRAPQYLKSIGEILGGDYQLKDWSQTQGSLFQAIQMEKTVTGVMLAVIIAVAAFNIVTSLIMMVAEKRSDIAVLRTLGISRQSVIKIFMIQGSAMGMFGIAAGALFGVLTAQYLPAIVAFFERLIGSEIFDPSVYFVTYLPSVWRLDDTLIVCVTAVIVSISATIYPALRAAAIAPAEALRYDM